MKILRFFPIVPYNEILRISHNKKSDVVKGFYFMLRKISLVLSICFLLHQNIAYGEDNQQSIYEKRMALYKETEQSSGITWYDVTAMDPVSYPHMTLPTKRICSN